MRKNCRCYGSHYAKKVRLRHCFRRHLRRKKMKSNRFWTGSIVHVDFKSIWNFKAMNGSNVLRLNLWPPHWPVSSAEFDGTLFEEPRSLQYTLLQSILPVHCPRTVHCDLQWLRLPQRRPSCILLMPFNLQISMCADPLPAASTFLSRLETCSAKTHNLRSRRLKFKEVQLGCWREK